MGNDAKIPVSDDMVRAIVDHVDDLVELIDGEGTLFYRSPSLVRLVGKEQLIAGENFFEYLHPDDREAIRKVMHDLPRDGDSRHIQYRLKLHDGILAHVDAEITLVTDASGNSCYVIVGHDLTDKNESESKERLLAYALSCTRDCFCLTDLEETILFVNPAFAKTYGYEEEELYGQKFDIVRSNAVPKEIRDEIREASMGGGWEGEVLHRRRKGDDFPVELWSSLIRNSAGEPVATVWIMRDISERRRTEELLRESESKFRSLIENSSDGIAVLDRSGRPRYFSSSSKRILGYPVNELMGMNIFDLVHPEDLPSVRSSFDKKLSDPFNLYPLQFRVKHRDGSWRVLESISKNLLQEPAINGVVINFRDITEQKQSEKIQTAVYRIAQAGDRVSTLDELYAAVHEIIRSIMPANNFYIALYDDKTNIIRFPYFVDEVDEPPSAHTPGKGLTEYVLRTGKPLLCTSETQSELERLNEAELIGVPSPIWLGVPLIIDKQPIGVMVVQHYTDASVYGEAEQKILEFVSSQVARAIEQKRSEEALRKSDERYRAFVGLSSDGIWRLELNPAVATALPANEQLRNIFEDGILGETNDVMAHFFGATDAKAIVGMKLKDLHLEHDTCLRELLLAFIRSGYRLIEHDACWKTDIHHTRYFHFSVIGIVEGGFLKQAWVTQQDVTEKRLSEDIIRVSEEKYRNLFEESHDGIIICTPEGELVDINQAGLELFGYDSVEELSRSPVGKDLYFHSEDRKTYWRNLERQGFVQNYEFVLVRRDGERRVVLESTSAVRDEGGKILSYRRFFQDITERKMLEEELRQAQKMEGIGTLAGGIAHDFNNLLGIILGYTTLLENDTIERAASKQSLEIIKKAVERGASLVRQLLTFARRADPTFESLDVNLTISELVKMLQQTFPKTLALKLSLAENIPPIIADSSQLHQALLNLSVNARDAMSEDYGGKGVGSITFETGVIAGSTLRPRFPASDAPLYVFIRVKDTGIGMDESTRQRMFEPFFTTKSLGKGTGLGLAVVYGVVNSHHGLVEVESEVNVGTTFSLYFPAQPMASTAPERPQTSVDTSVHGHETLLIVEDEEMLRDLLKSVLEDKGYRVLTANDGIEGYEMFRDHHEEITLVLSDMGLPRMGGWEMFQKMRELDPGVPVILASGYFEPKLKLDLINAGAKDFVQKPYIAEDIHRRIREIIEHAPA